MSIANPLPGQPLPVSIIVNTVDRAAALATLLAALEHQSYTHFEVIVVVGPTHDETLTVLAPYAERVRVLHCPHANLSESRNIGLWAARGDIVAFIDDDAVPSYHWLAQIVDTFAAAEAAGLDIAVVGGSVYMVHPNQPTIQHWLGIMSDLGEAHDVREGAEHDDRAKPEGMGIFWTERPMGANMAFRRAALLAVGGFDTYYEWVFDDADIAMRLALAGYGVRSLTEAPVYHVPASSRNRVVRTFTGRWWIISQASTYFAVQNGRAARQPVSQVLLRVLHLIHGAWLVNGELYRAGYISRRDMWARRLRAMTAGAHGAVDGLRRRRLWAYKPGAASTSGTDQIRPFPVPSGRDVPSVDPVDGTRGSGPFAKPPLRIGLLAQPFVTAGPLFAADQLAAVTTALFAIGHTVHVLGAADRRTIIFRDGAYFHSELHFSDAAALLTGLRRLLENDGIQWLIGVPEDLAAAAAAHLVTADPPVPVAEAAQPASHQRAAPVSAPGSSGSTASAGYVLPEDVRRAIEPLLEAGCAAVPTAQLSSTSWSPL